MNALASVSASWWQWMTAMSLQVTFPGLVVSLLDILFGRRLGPRLLYGLWLLVLIKLLLPPTLGSPLSVARLLPETAAVEETTTPAIPRVLGLIWLAGVGTLSLGLLWRWRRSRKEWLDQTAAAPPELVAQVERLAQRLCLRSLPPIRLHLQGAGPAVVGILRPILIVPAGFLDAATPLAQEHVLLHELSHVRRWDPLLALLGTVLQIVYWFHPVVWLARRRLETIRELCCDQAVVRATGGDALAYRRTLLQMARPLLETANAGSLPLISRQAQLLTRLDWLQRPRSRPHWLRSLACCGLFVSVALCCVPLARPLLPPRPLVEEVAALPPGCLQLRYLVLGQLALTEAAGTPDAIVQHSSSMKEVIP